jgi:hypothetical protein
LALLCSAIFSFRAFREAPGPIDFEKEAVLVDDEESEPLFGLFGSFSRAVFSRLSSVSNILKIVLVEFIPMLVCGQTNFSAL